MKGKLVIVNDIMQHDFTYVRSEEEGCNFRSDFCPELSPAEMLALGVFGGRYMTDCINEFPASWFAGAKLCHERHVPELNYFGINASLPLSVWREKNWIHPDDPRGWFQWYCRYFSGRRCEDDARQIDRWKAMKRHLAQVKINCAAGDLSCRIKQRQALMNWAYDSRKI